MIFLELNDWELKLFDQNNSTLFSEPAVASYQNDKLIFGNEALLSARLRPQTFANQYLKKLNSERLTQPLGQSKNQADLLYQQIKSLQINEEVVALIPSRYDNQQLGLFLGIAKQAGLKIKGFVDTALAYALESPSPKAMHVFDIEMHQASITKIKCEDRYREIQSTALIEALGFTSIVNGWINVITDEFIQKTRFDPLHFAETEQQLFNAINSSLGEDSSRETSFKVTQKEQDRTVSVNPQLLTDKLKSRVKGSDFDQVECLIITPRVLRISGLKKILQKIIPRVVIAESDQLADNLLKLTKEMTDASITRISAGFSSKAEPRESSNTNIHAKKQRIATHLLLDGHAYRLENPKLIKTISNLQDPLLPGETIVIEGETYSAISAD